MKYLLLFLSFSQLFAMDSFYQGINQSLSLASGCSKNFSDFAADYPRLLKVKGISYQETLWEAQRNKDALNVRDLKEEITQMLKKGKVMDQYALGEGLTGAEKAVLEMEVHAIIKQSAKNSLRPELTGMNEEVAAYLVDSLFDFFFTPITVTRQLEGKTVSVQLFVADAISAESYLGRLSQTEKDKLALFDFLINNSDRHAGNILVSGEGRIIAIDHGSSFGNSAAGRVPPPTEINLDFFQSSEGKRILYKLRNQSDSNIRIELMPYLDVQEIRNFITRKNKILILTKNIEI